MDWNSIGQSAIGSGIQFGLNTVGGLINQAFAKRNARIQAEYNKELMGYQAELQQQQIDKENAYNTPLAQMERLKDAGLNPNLAYGNLSSSNQTSVPKVSSPAPANFQNTDGGFQQINQYIDVVGKIAQIQKTINDTKTTDSKVGLSDVETQISRWKLDNLLPLMSAEKELTNIGLGYDNSIKRERSLKARDIVNAELRYQENLADKTLQDSIYRQLEVGILPSEWELRKRAMQLANTKEKVAISNMKSQNLLLGITYNFEKWAKKRLKDAGIIPGINSSSSETSSHGISTPFGGGNASTSGSYSGPIKFR